MIVPLIVFIALAALWIGVTTPAATTRRTIAIDERGEGDLD